MDEQFLHYLWQFQQFDKSNLQTTAGEPITVFKTGFLNTNAGPDFTDARLQIGEIEWVGSIEIHIKSSDWNLHNHQIDKSYENVILHVVWEYNGPILRQDGSEIPTLELKSLTDNSLRNKYRNLVENQSKILCESRFSAISELSKVLMLDKILTRRLEQKAKLVDELLVQNNGDWEETTYQLLAKNFGFKLNSEPFLRLARQTPLKILQKQRDNLFQIEALLFGQSGLLNESFDDEYSKKLWPEYQFLSKKYSLEDTQVSAHEWKFLRTRPTNFPTVRIAQFAQLIYSRKGFFSGLIQIESAQELKEFFKISQSVYWQTHYNFGKKSSVKMMGLGNDSIENLIINSTIPLMVAYAQSIDNQLLIEKAIRFLEAIKAEKNSITQMWESLGVELRTAYESQGYIELYNNYCSQKKCLQCNIGIEILK